MKMVVLVALLALGGIGFVLLRKPPVQVAVEDALVGTEAGITLETATAKVDLGKAASIGTRDALLRGDVLGAFILGITAISTIGARLDARHAWIDAIVEVWNELPDSWFLERSREQAGLEVAEFLPRPGRIVNLTELQWWERFFETSSFADSYYNRLRDGYNARLLVARKSTITPEQSAAIEVARLDLIGRLGWAPLPPSDVELVEYVTASGSVLFVTPEKLSQLEAKRGLVA